MSGSPQAVIRLAALLTIVAFQSIAYGEKIGKSFETFLSENCYDCHSGQSEAEAGLDLQRLSRPAEGGDLSSWIRVFDRVRTGEMPPEDYGQPEASDVTRFFLSLKKQLTQNELRLREERGRVPARRLTKLQLESTLHDLLGIDIPLASELPDEPRTDGFTTVSEGQAISHFQLQDHLRVVDLALDEAFRRVTSQADMTVSNLSAGDIVRSNPRRRTREPELIDGKAVVWSAGITFYGRLPATTAKEDGWYRFTAKVSALNPPEGQGVWCTVRSGRCVSSAPLLPFVTSFEAESRPRSIEFEAWLPKGHMLEIRPGDVTLKRGRFRGGQVGTGEGTPQELPGLAIHKMTMQRIHRSDTDEAVGEKLFPDLSLSKRDGRWMLASDDPVTDAQRCLQSFAERAFRYPVSETQLAPYLASALSALESGMPLMDALRNAYRTILCSPRFLFLREETGPLDDFAVANRLSYFLWGTMPDKQLWIAADAGLLTQENEIREQVERMLNDPRGKAFVRRFSDQWLDLNQINFTSPDRRLYPEFDLIVQQAMLGETYAFLQELLDEDLSVRNFVSSDFTYLNSRLARYYGIPGIQGDQLCRTSLQPNWHRGGLITQGSVLKVTANGTTTSPVVRGVWIADRILGEDIPPPPPNVPAIEPDIRGAQSIREMLAMHRAEPSCAGCHRKFDPPGFALENFDAAGRWRDRYLRLEGRKRKPGPDIDPSYTLEDGRHFDDLEDFKKLIASSPKLLARNLAAKLLTYGTGGPISFSDRDTVDAIANEASSNNYGFRSLVKAVATSDTFLSK